MILSLEQLQNLRHGLPRPERAGQKLMVPIDRFVRMPEPFYAKTATEVQYANSALFESVWFEDSDGRNLLWTCSRITPAI